MYRQMSNFRSNLTRNIPINQTRSLLGNAIGVPKANGLFKSMLGSSSLTNTATSKLGLGGILGGISKTVNTINQAMPIFNQVKPLIGNAKSIVNVVKGFRNKQNHNKQNENVLQKENIINENKPTKREENIQNNYQFTPNSPFFNNY